VSKQADAQMKLLPKPKVAEVTNQATCTLATSGGVEENPKGNPSPDNSSFVTQSETTPNARNAVPQRQLETPPTKLVPHSSPTESYRKFFVSPRGKWKKTVKPKIFTT